MQFQISKVCRPDEGGEIVRQTEIDGILVPFAPNRGDFQPLGAESGASFLIEELSFNSVRIAFECQRPVFEMRQENGRDADVIVDNLTFGETGGGVEDFVQTRDGNRFAVDLEGGRCFPGSALSGVAGSFPLSGPQRFCSGSSLSHNAS